VLVIRTRAYPRNIVLPPLVAEGLLVKEVAPGAEMVAALTNLRPRIVIFAGDESEASLEIVQHLASVGDSLRMALLPEGCPETEARYLCAGADLVARDSDGDAVLDAQIRALIRRAGVTDGTWAPGRMALGEVAIDVAAHQATVRGKPVPLTPAEFRILLTLAVSAGQVVSARDLLGAVVGEDGTTAEARGFAKVHIARIRRKLEEAGCPAETIRTVRGAGYIAG